MLTTQIQVAKREGLAEALPTWTSSSSNLRSNTSSFSFKDANLLFVVASEKTHIKCQRCRIKIQPLRCFWCDSVCSSTHGIPNYVKDKNGDVVSWKDETTRDGSFCREKRRSVCTELDKEVEEAMNVERNVRDEFAVLPIGLHRDSHVHCVCYPSRASHVFFHAFPDPMLMHSALCTLQQIRMPNLFPVEETYIFLFTEYIFSEFNFLTIIINVIYN